MQRHYGLLTFLSIVVVAVTAYTMYMGLHVSALPFARHFISADVAVVHPLSTMPLPESLKDGDEIDLNATAVDARFALYTGQWDNLPEDHTYQLAVRRGGTVVMVPVTTQRLSDTHDALLLDFPKVFIAFLFGVIALILLWRSRGQAAWMMTGWAVAYTVAITFEYIPGDGVLSLVLICGARGFYLVGRFFFYCMAESMLSAALTSRNRGLYRASFALMFVAGTAWAIGAPMVMIFTGSLRDSHPVFSLFYSFIYVVPTVMFFLSYRSAQAETRARLRWMLWSSALFLFSVSVRNLGDTILPIGYIASYTLYFTALTLALLGFLYVLLRHRVVDVSVAIDRTLVYGGLTTLVAGLVAAVNSLALKAALGEGASLLLQVVVPLSLGIVLVRVRTYLDMFVERVFFRRKYLADQALRAFARRCGHIGNVGHLFEAAAKEIHKQTGSPGVAIYTASGTGYVRMQQSGDMQFPAQVDGDDAALVAVRAELKSVELVSLDSRLGVDGCVFPMVVLGLERGVIVLANRPGEKFGLDERSLLGQVACDVGAAWRILWARRNEDFVRTVARGELDIETAKAQARSLETAWASA